MAINLDAPSVGQSPQLVVDSKPFTGGSVDAVLPFLTQVGGNPVQTCQEWNSVYPTLLPRISFAALSAINPAANGMLAYDSTNNGLALLANGQWTSFNGGMVAVSLTQAQIQGMFAAPIQLIAAPGAGLSVVIDKIVAVNTFAVAAFQNGGAVTIGYGATAALNALTATIPATFVNSAASAIYRLSGAAFATQVVTGTANQPVFITNATGAFTNGNAASVVKFYIWYSIIAT